MLGWKATLEATEELLDEMVEDGLLVKLAPKGEHAVRYTRCM